jgi:hypothetical protein
MSDALPTLTPQEYARRLIRARTWHLYNAGRMRLRAQDVLAEAARSEGMAASLETEIRGLGFDPQPPMGPRPA